MVKRPPEFHAAITYCHRDALEFARRLHTDLERFHRPPWKARSMRVFRDETNLDANPDFFSSIQRALDASRFLIVIASPAAPQSKWVAAETRHFASKHGIAKVITVLTRPLADEPDIGATLPAWLFEQYQTCSITPFMLDMSDLLDGPVSLDHPLYRDRIATLAACLLDRDKDELVGEHVTRRRQQSFLAIAICAVLALAVAAFAWQWSRARKSSRQALENATASRTASQQAFISQAVSDARALLPINPLRAGVTALQAQRGALEVDRSGLGALLGDHATLAVVDCLRDAIGAARRVHRGSVLDLAAVPGSDAVLSSGWDGRVTSFESTRSLDCWRHEGFARPVTSLCTSREGAWAGIQSLSSARIVHVDRASGIELSAMPVGGLRCVAFSPTADRVALGHDDGTLSLGSYNSDAVTILASTLLPTGTRPRLLEFTPDGTALAVVCATEAEPSERRVSEDILALFDVFGGRALLPGPSWLGHWNRLERFGDSLLCSELLDDAIELYRIDTCPTSTPSPTKAIARRIPIELPLGAVYAWDDERDRIACIARNGRLQILQAGDDETLRTICELPTPGPVRHLAFSADGGELLAIEAVSDVRGAGDALVRWSLPTDGTPTRSSQRAVSEGRVVCWRVENERILLGDTEGVVRMITPADWEVRGIERTVAASRGPVWSLASSDDDRTLAWGENEGVLAVAHIGPNRAGHIWRGRRNRRPIDRLEVSADARWIALKEQTETVFDPSVFETWEHVGDGEYRMRRRVELGSAVFTWAMSPFREELVAASFDGVVRSWTWSLVPNEPRPVPRLVLDARLIAMDFDARTERCLLSDRDGLLTLTQLRPAGALSPAVQRSTAKLAGPAHHVHRVAGDAWLAVTSPHDAGGSSRLELVTAPAGVLKCRELCKLPGTVYGFAFDAARLRVAVFGDEGGLTCVDLASGAQRRLEFDVASISSAAIDAEGSWIAVGSKDGSVRVTRFPLDDSRLDAVLALGRHAGEINDMRFSRASGRLYTCGVDGNVREWAYKPEDVGRLGENVVGRLPSAQERRKFEHTGLPESGKFRITALDEEIGQDSFDSLDIPRFEERRLELPREKAVLAELQHFAFGDRRPGVAESLRAAELVKSEGCTERTLSQLQEAVEIIALRPHEDDKDTDDSRLFGYLEAFCLRARNCDEALDAFRRVLDAQADRVSAPDAPFSETLLRGDIAELLWNRGEISAARHERRRILDAEVAAASPDPSSVARAFGELRFVEARLACDQRLPREGLIAWTEAFDTLSVLNPPVLDKMKVCLGGCLYAADHADKTGDIEWSNRCYRESRRLAELLIEEFGQRDLSELLDKIPNPPSDH